KRDHAAAAAKHLKARSMAWLEEPIRPPDDLPRLAALRKETGMTIAAGENASGIQGLLLHFALGSVDVAQPSVAKIGGISGMLQSFDTVRQYGCLAVPPFCYHGPRIQYN